MSDKIFHPPSLHGHIPALDGLRGVAILLVMFIHFTVINPIGTIEVWFQKVAYLGMHGVDLFFVLSGYLITSILLDTKGKENFLRNFYMRRILRIFPLYYAIVALSFLILPILLSHFTAGTAKLARFDAVSGDWIWYVLYCSNFLIARTEAIRHGILDVTWSLAIEEQFYMIWGITVLLSDKKLLKRICISVIFCALLFRTVLWLSGFSWLQIYMLTPSRIDTIAWGAMISIITRSSDYDAEKLTKDARIIMVITGIILSIFFMSEFLHYASPVSYTIGYSLIGAFFAQILISVLNAPKGSIVNRIFASGFLTFFGKYSYAIYLFHLPIRAVIRDLFFGDKQFHTLPGPAIVWQMVFYIVATLAVIPPTLLSWYLFENPFLKLKKYFYYQS